jgi:glycosyltransferase involved in cell wall biosynthesis
MTENGMLVTDTDIDLMVRVKDDQNWQVVKKEIEKRLKTLDPEWIKFESHNHDIGISREPKFSCYYNKRWGLKCYGNDDIHVDIHSYMVDEKNNRIFMDPVCNGNDKCANKYPFQKWGGYAPYRGLIVDDKGLFKKCKFGNMTLNCPYQSIKLLSNWNDKEYGTGDDLHLPRGNCVFKNSCWKNGDNTLSSTDKLRLKNIAKKLHDGGFESFYSYYDADKDFKMTNKPLTIITAYFDLGKNSKKGPEGSNKYLKWIPSLLSYSGPMIIFVDSKTIEYIKTIRNGLPTIIVPSEIEDLMCNKYSGKFQLQKGPWYKSLGNGNANEDKLGIIWNEKLNFLRQGIELSTFDTPYYAWYDIGYIRNGNKIPSSWPSESKLRMGGEKVNLLTFSPKSDWCQFPYHKNEKLSYEEPPHGVMLTGGFILGTPEALKKFYTLFYNTLDEMIAQKEYTGNEQFTFSKCYCKNRDLFNLIIAVPHEFVDNDKWFYGVPHYLVQSPEKEKAMEVLENMNINELLTIGIKTFYRPHCLNNCIKVIRSFYPNIFIIVTDDSSDEVKLQNQDVIRKFKKIKYISLPYDTGLSKSRNIMVRHCPTKYFMITDDDFYLSKAFNLEKAIAALEFHNADLISGKLVSNTGNNGTWTHNFVDIKSKESHNLVGEKFIVKYNENRNYLENPYLEKTFKTSTTHNHLIANTESLLASPWRDELKVGEHEIFFVDWYNNGFTVLCSEELVFHELSGDDRKYLPGTEKFRNRTDNEFQPKKWVVMIHS